MESHRHGRHWSNFSKDHLKYEWCKYTNWKREIIRVDKNQDPAIWWHLENSFSGFPFFGWPGQLWEVLSGILLNVPQLGLVIFFSWLAWGYGSGEEDQIREVAFSGQLSRSTAYQHDLSWLMSTFIISWSWWFQKAGREKNAGLQCAVYHISQVILTFPPSLFLLVQSFFQRPIHSLQIVKGFVTFSQRQLCGGVTCAVTRGSPLRRAPCLFICTTASTLEFLMIFYSVIIQPRTWI